MGKQSGQNVPREVQNRADTNRFRRVQAIRELERLLREATEPAFTGTVSVRLSAKGGMIGKPVTTTERWAEE